MDSVEALIFRLKYESHLSPENTALSVAAPGGELIRMRPLPAVAEQVSPGDVALLTDWRNRNREYFLTNFIATEERTHQWVVGVIGPDLSRILFMLDDAVGQTFGHVGLCNIEPAASYAELDNIVRGDGGPKGAMAATVQALCGWTREALGLRRLAVRVMADNPAVGFYERLGFRFVKDTPLRKEQEADSLLRWVVVPEEAAPSLASSRPAERYLRYMELPT
jgi:RimJ/RimL family protein N-acetyltransferase